MGRKVVEDTESPVPGLFRSIPSGYSFKLKVSGLTWRCITIRTNILVSFSRAINPGQNVGDFWRRILSPYFAAFSQRTAPNPHPSVYFQNSSQLEGATQLIERTAHHAHGRNVFFDTTKRQRQGTAQDCEWTHQASENFYSQVTMFP